jgi:hypothetical protein
MKIQHALFAFALSAILSCGDEFLPGSDAGTSSYAFTGGTFAVTNAVLASSTDECNLLGAYTDPTKKIRIDQAGSVLTFNLANDASAAANSLPKAVLDGNVIGQATEANYTVAFDNSCVVRIKRTVTGQVVADYTAALTLSFSVDTEAGCVTNTTSFPTLPCASIYQFTATKE